MPAKQFPVSTSVLLHTSSRSRSQDTVNAKLLPSRQSNWWPLKCESDVRLVGPGTMLIFHGAETQRYQDRTTHI